MTSKNHKDLSNNELEFVDDQTGALLLNTPTHARLLLWVVATFFVIAIIWASWAQIDQVTAGIGKVVPSSQIQVVQNLEGGLVKSILVREGQSVTKGQQLLLIDDTRFRSDFREREQQISNLSASVMQLAASIHSIEINEKATGDEWEDSVLIHFSKLVFPYSMIEAQPALVKRHQDEYKNDLEGLRNQISAMTQQVKQKQQDLIEAQARVKNLQQSYEFAREEMEITKPLAEEGVVPQLEFLKLQRQVNDNKRELTSAKLKIPLLQAAIQESKLNRINTALKFRSEQQDLLNQAEDSLSAMSESSVGLEDRVNRTVVVSPVTGTIKTLNVNTVGGVIQPGMDIVEIVPTEDTLLVEAKIAPKDIAFLRPGLDAIVKFSAYDFVRYGGLSGKLEHISADTSEDEEGNSYYLVRIRTNETSFDEDNTLPIIPGMTTSVDIITGKRTVIDYLLKPILNAQHTALRE